MLIAGRGGAFAQRKFEPATAAGKSHLRFDGSWRTNRGPAIATGDPLLLDDNAGNEKNAAKATWKPALNVSPQHNGPVAANRKGYIRSTKATLTGGSLQATEEARISRILQDAEQLQPWLAGHLDKPKHVAFLMEKGIRYAAWSGAALDNFAEAFGTSDQKFQRLADGANYVAGVLDHWKSWLYPEGPDQVVVDSVELVKSDLHERGLGVVEVKFTKPKGGTNPQFKKVKKVHAFIKPEDKSLEQNLLGAGPDSAVNKINKIAKLKGAERLRGIKMESTNDNGTFVEAAKGVRALDLWGDAPVTSDKPASESFHETLIFAYLAGIDDLHMKNVFWDQGGTPSLIDADNVLSRNQMEKVDNGKLPQSGFGKYFNNAEAQKSQNAIVNQDNSEINSKILNVMLTNQTKRREIINVLKAAIQGHRGRVVPVRTDTWGKDLKGYPVFDAIQKDGYLDFVSEKGRMVREMAVDGVGFSDAVGPGLFGTTGKNTGNPFYSQPTERAQTKADFDSGVIPFYEYEFDTGFVTHNGAKIYHGQTLDQAMQGMLDKFGG